MMTPNRAMQLLLNKSSTWRQPEAANGPLTEEQVFAMIGFMLFRFHGFEKLLRICTAVIERSAAAQQEIDAIESFWGMRHHSLGKLANTIRGFAEVDLSFDKVLRRLVRRRNVFAHKLAVHTPFSPTRGKAWLQNVPRFIWALNDDLEQVEYVFETYARALKRQREGHPDYIFDEEEVTQFLRLKGEIQRRRKRDLAFHELA
jgi:hypothetical protein